MKENKSFWNRYASDFDSIYGTKNSWFNNIINKLFRETMKIRFEKTIQIVPKEEVSVIDIGCGPGHYCFSLAKVGVQNIKGIDFSETMISLAKDHAEELGLKNIIDFEVVNFLEFEPSSRFSRVDRNRSSLLARDAASVLIFFCMNTKLYNSLESSCKWSITKEDFSK